MRLLKQSTAVEVKVGPFVDQTDGVTAEDGLTISQADVRLAKNGGDWAQKSETTTLVHEEGGWYRCLLDTTDTDTLGVLMLAIAESGALKVWHEFMVMPANVWDSMFGSDKLQVDVAEWLGTAAATPTTAGVPEVDVTHIAGSAVSTSSAQLGVNVVNAGGTAWGSGAITAASIASNAIAAAKIASGAITSAKFAAGAIDAAAIADAAIDAATFAADVDAEILSYIVDDATRIDASDLNTEIDALKDGGRLDLLVDAIKAKTDSLTFTVAGQVDANALTIDEDEILDDTLTDSVPADGSLPSVRQALYMIVQFLTERAVSGTTVTVNKVDGSTALMTFTLNDATSPTSITRTT